MIYEDYIKVLYIDLANERIRVEKRKDLTEYLGGVGVASKLLEENMKADLSPLHEDQPAIFATGAASTIFPVITKTVAMFISPLTGELGESYAGGRMALALFMAGYDAVVLTGKSKKPSYLSITGSNIYFRDARAFKGLSSKEIGRFIRERESGGGKRSILRIGPAGENLVSYASVCVDTYRHFGRLGLGAVLGSKNLKAIAITGDRSIPIKEPKEYLKVYQDVYKKCTDTEIMSKYHDAGTPINIEPLNIAGGLPTLNLQKNSFDHAEAISGETFAEKNLIRKMACTGCPVGCIHIGQFRKEFDKGHEYEAISVGYDYELIFSLGSFIGVDSTEAILELIDTVEEMGMDAMSTGVILGWATEAYMNKLLTIEETLVPLEFGNKENYLKAIEHIAYRRNEFYDALAKGVFIASEKYGGKEFAMSIGKNEMPGYHTGYGALVGAAVGARHSHLCNGGYSLDQNMKEFDKEKLVEGLFKEEIERCMLNCLGICLFARKIYDRQTILPVLKVLDHPLNDEELTAVGEKIFKTKLRIKKALGFELKDLELPKRFFDTPSMTGIMDEKMAYELVELFQKKCDDLLNRKEPDKTDAS